MSTNAQVAVQAAAVGGETEREADLTPRVTAFFTWLEAACLPAPRQVHDASTTNANPALVSVAAAYTATDQGAGVAGAGIPGGTTITVTDASHAAMSANATATAANVNVTITPVVTTRSIGNAQAALLGAAQAFAGREGTDPVRDVLNHANQLLADVAAHAAGQGV